MPKLSLLLCRGRVKAYNTAIHALQLELDDPENSLHETLVEVKRFLEKLKKERRVFARHHGIEI